MQAIIFVGIQGSGKSTFYQHHFFQTHVRLSLDLLRTRHRQRVFLDACLKTQQRFVIDNTNVRKEERKVYVEAAIAARFEVIGYYFNVPLKQALSRNSQRTGKQLIPTGGVISAFRKMEPPAYDEGFHQLYTVEIVSTNQWTVTPIERPAPAIEAS